MPQVKSRNLDVRLREILKVILGFGGTVTTKKVAEKMQLTVSGVSQSLNALKSRGYVKYLNGQKGEKQWRIIRLPKI